MDQLERMITQIDTLNTKFITLKSQYTLQQDNLTKQIETLKGQIIKDQNHINLLQQSQDIFKLLQDKLTIQQIQHLQTLCNDALVSVFNDEQFSYHIDIQTKTDNQKPQAMFILTTTNNLTQEQYQTNLQSNGYGIQSLIGFILQVYYIINTHQQHILFIDEGLTAISHDHLPALKEFMTQISQKFQFIFILVVHDPDLLQLADYTYTINNGQVIKYTEEPQNV